MNRFLFLLFSLVEFSSIVARTPINSGKSDGDPKNSLKINLLPLFFQTYSVQYERRLLKNISFCVQGAYNSQMRLGTFINRVLDTVSDERLNIIRAKVSLSELSTTNSIYLTPEFRLYISRHGVPNGFYLAPYLRFSSTTVHAIFTYKDSSLSEIPILFTGQLSGIHPGVMFGYQKSFLKRIVVDFWFGGVQFGSSKASFDAYADFKKVDKQGLINFVQNNFKYGTSTLTIDSDEHALIQYLGKSSGFRIGLCVGFRF